MNTLSYEAAFTKNFQKYWLFAFVELFRINSFLLKKYQETKFFYSQTNNLDQILGAESVLITHLALYYILNALRVIKYAKIDIFRQNIFLTQFILTNAQP